MANVSPVLKLVLRRIPRADVPALEIPVVTALPATSMQANSFYANWEEAPSGFLCYLTVARDAGFNNIVPGFNSKLVTGSTCLVDNLTMSVGTTFYYKLRCSTNGIIFGKYSNIISVRLGYAESGTIEVFSDPDYPDYSWWIYTFHEDGSFRLIDNIPYPENIITVMIGGGGGGGGVSADTNRPGGGGASGDFVVTGEPGGFSPVAGETYNIHIGAGGAGGLAGQRGQAGQDTTIQGENGTWSAKGGNGGGAGLPDYDANISDGGNEAGHCGGGASNGHGGVNANYHAGGDGYESGNDLRGGGGASASTNGHSGLYSGKGGEGYSMSDVNELFAFIIAGGGGSGGRNLVSFNEGGSLGGGNGAGNEFPAGAGQDYTGAGGGGGSNSFRTGGRGGCGAVYVAIYVHN